MDLPIPTWHVMKPIFISYSKKRELSITWNIVQWNFKTKKNTVRSTTSTHSQKLFTNCSYLYFMHFNPCCLQNLQLNHIIYLMSRSLKAEREESQERERKKKKIFSVHGKTLFTHHYVYIHKTLFIHHLFFQSGPCNFQNL